MSKKNQMIDMLTQQLTQAFSPCHVKVEDESSQHTGHAGWRPGGETHFAITIQSPLFEGLSRVAQHRLVHSVLKQHWKQGSIHAVRIDCETKPFSQMKDT